MSRKLLHPSRSFYAIVWGILFGIAFSTFFDSLLFPLAWWILPALIFCTIALLLPTHFTLPLAFCAGIIFSNLRLAPLFISRSTAEYFYGQDITLIGQITEDPTTSSNKSVIRLQNLQIVEKQPELVDNLAKNVENEVENSQQNVEKNIVYLQGTAYVQLDKIYSELERSDIVTLDGIVSEGFGTFLFVMYRPALIDISRTEIGDPFARLKNWFSDLIKDYIPSPEVGLGLGYLMGMKTDLSDSLSETLQLVGMTHVIVASGAHLGILVGSAKKIFGRISKFASLFGSSILILAFVSIVGFTPSMTRASLVSIINLSFGFIGRRFIPLRLLSLVATITLLINPTNLLNLGWQLSFASFFGLLIISPRLLKTFYGGKAPPWLASMLLTSLSTTLTCAPILIYNFGSISLLSFVANLIILPTLPYVMLLVFLTGATSLLPILATIIAKAATLLLDLHIAIVNYLSTKTIFIITLPAENPYIFLLYLPLLIWLISPFLLKFIKNICMKRAALQPSTQT